MVDETVITRSVATKQSQTIDILRYEIASPPARQGLAGGSARNDITNQDRIVPTGLGRQPHTAHIAAHELLL